VAQGGVVTTFRCDEDVNLNLELVGVAGEAIL
jgi:hypothetical protein